jgi:hypothetical protein
MLGMITIRPSGSCGHRRRANVAACSRRWLHRLLLVLPPGSWSDLPPQVHSRWCPSRLPPDLTLHSPMRPRSWPRGHQICWCFASATRRPCLCCHSRRYASRERSSTTLPHWWRERGFRAAGYWQMRNSAPRFVSLGDRFARGGKVPRFTKFA